MQLDPLRAEVGMSGAAPGQRAAGGTMASRAAADFERMVVAQMLRQFTAGALREGEAESPFATMLQDAYAGAIADSGRIGIATSLLRALGTTGDPA